MAIRYNDTTTHEGKVVHTYNQSSYHDDYEYAIVYETGENGEYVFREELFWTTAFAGGGSAQIDAPTEVIEAYHRMKREQAEAKERAIVRKGKTVEVVRGRKVPVGTMGFVFWMGPNRFDYGRTTTVGIQTETGERHFTALGNVETVQTQTL